MSKLLSPKWSFGRLWLFGYNHLRLLLWNVFNFLLNCRLYYHVFSAAFGQLLWFSVVPYLKQKTFNVTTNFSVTKRAHSFTLMIISHRLSIALHCTTLQSHHFSSTFLTTSWQQTCCFCFFGETFGTVSVDFVLSGDLEIPSGDL